MGLNVPHDVAILGVDNDLTACEFSHLSLSSVSTAAWQIGFEAARLLDGLMNGQPAPNEEILIPPDGVIRRRSTDTIIVGDPNVSIAVQYMRDHLGEMFGIQQVMKHVPVSRRRLHERFQRLLNRTPYEYLCYLRVERERTVSGETAHQDAQDRQRMRILFARADAAGVPAFDRHHAAGISSAPRRSGGGEVTVARQGH